MSIQEAPLLEIDKIVNVIQRRCDSNGVTLKWSPRATTASTDGKTIILPVIRRPITADALWKLYGFIVHEPGHHSRKEAFEILKAAKPSTALSALYNIVEDDGMEREVASKYKGDAKALGMGNNVILKQLAEAWGEQFAKYNGPPLTDADMAPVAACGLAQLSRIEWDGWSNPARAAYMNAMPKEGTKLLEELVKEGWVERLKQTKTPHDTWDVACDLYMRLFPNADKDKVEAQRKAGHSKQEGNGDKSDASGKSGGASSTSDGAGDDAQTPSGTKAAVDKGSAKVDEPEPEGRVVSWKDAVLSEHNEWKPQPQDVQPGNIGIDWTDYKEGEIALMPESLINVVDCRKDDPKLPLTRNHKPEKFMADNSQARQFASQIRRYIQARAKTKVLTERYHGRIDQRGLVKLAMPPIDGGEWNKRLFYDMIDAKALNTCIHVLTDWSGSMQGTKMQFAADASGRLVHTFDRVLRVPVQLAAFSNGYSACDIGIIKRFNDRSVSPLDIATAFSRFSSYTSANNDADALLWAYREIMKRNEERKILIVLSDGCPAGAWGRGKGDANLKYVTNRIQNEKAVELYGVGIKSNAVQTYYKNCKVLNDESEINNTLFQVIKEGVKR